MEIRKLHKYTLVRQDKIASYYINTYILKNKNVLVPQLFLKVLNILNSVKPDTEPFNKPKKVEFKWADKSYEGEIIKKLNTNKLKTDIYEVKIDQHPSYYRILFIMENSQLINYTLFTFGFIKKQNIDDVETNYYCLYSSQVFKSRSKLKKGVDFV